MHFFFWAISSVGSEHLPYKQGVTGSSPVSPTISLESIFCSPKITVIVDCKASQPMKKNILSFLSIAFLLFTSCQQIPETNLENEALIPFPQKVSATKSAFAIESKHTLGISGKELSTLASQLSEEWKEIFENKITVLKAGEKADIQLELSEETIDTPRSNESYRLEINEKTITLRAFTQEGIYRAWQTLKQLLLLSEGKVGVRFIPTGIIEDAPNYEYRGAMLDVSRHFFSVKEVKRYIDQLALYKINTLHLHLTDDQGWRIEIKSWPNLTAFGAKTEVGGTPGGFYTQEDYKELVSYAAKKFITIVPEIDMPGHTNAALSSYPKLNCNGKEPKPYTGIEVGFSSFCIQKELTYKFIDDVLREVSALTPGPYLHIGGDESHATKKKNFITFINRVIPMAKKYGKKVIGWDEIQLGNLSGEEVVQYWAKEENALEGKKKGAKVLMSPAKYAYLDMKYDSTFELGLVWAGCVDVKKGYHWTPETLVEGISKENIIGVEAPLWSETITNSQELEQLAFPRLLGYSEISWTEKEKRNWENYKKRLAVHSKIFKKFEINFYKSPLIEWEGLE